MRAAIRKVDMATQRSSIEMASSEESVALDQFSRGRRVSFRVVAVLAALWLLALNFFGLTEIVLEWLPSDTLTSMLGDYTAVHRVHYLAVGIISWAVVLSIFVQLRKPERRVAPALLLVATALGGAVVYGLSGTVQEWLTEEIMIVLIPIALVVLLHPARSRFLARLSFDRALAGMAAVATVPWLVFIVDNAWRQFSNLAGDPHAEMEHWATAALMGIVISAAAWLGASNHPGRKLTGWIAAVGSLLFGLHSLMFPGLASALPAFWGVTSILWAVGFGVLLARGPNPAEPSLVAR